MIDIKRQIASRLREERMRVGMSKVQLAGTLGVSRFTVANYESGSHMPTADQLTRLAMVGGDASYVVTGVKSMAHAEQREQLVKTFLKLQEFSRLAGMKLSNEQILLAALEFHYGGAKSPTDESCTTADTLSAWIQTVSNFG